MQLLQDGDPIQSFLRHLSALGGSIQARALFAAYGVEDGELMHDSKTLTYRRNTFASLNDKSVDAVENYEDDMIVELEHHLMAGRVGEEQNPDELRINKVHKIYERRRGRYYDFVEKNAHLFRRLPENATLEEEIAYKVAIAEAIERVKILAELSQVVGVPVVHEAYFKAQLEAHVRRFYYGELEKWEAGREAHGNAVG
jgi:hypothetical protein